MGQWTGYALVQVMACHLFGAKLLPEPILTYCQLDPKEKEQTSVKFKSKYKKFNPRKCIWKCRLRNGGHFVQGEMPYWLATIAGVNNLVVPSHPCQLNTMWTILSFVLGYGHFDWLLGYGHFDWLLGYGHFDWLLGYGHFNCSIFGQ